MKPRDEFQKLWRESFADSDEFVDMFFSRVYNDDDLIYLSPESGAPLASALLLQPYAMTFHGHEEPMAYICGAATKRAKRGKGLMSGLLLEVLAESRRRGHTFCSLIPAHSWLYDYYARFGFSSVFLVHDDRYTALHPFNTEGTYTAVDDLFDDAVFEAFASMEREQPCRVLHSRRDFLNIVDDNSLDGGAIAAMRDADGRIVSIAFAVERDDIVRVTDLMGDSEDARTAALRQIRASFPGRPFNVPVTPVEENLESRRPLSPTGMCRIINAGRCLEAIAAANPRWNCRIRVTDPIIQENNGVFTARRGAVTVEQNASGEMGTDLDVSIEVLTEIVFSSPAIGNVMGVPSMRPRMALMLD